MLLSDFVPSVCSEEMRTDKRIGFFAGLREVLGFRPYMLLILIELFSWLAAQVRDYWNSPLDY